MIVAVISPRASPNSAFNLSHSSDAMCGANGLSRTRNVRIADNGIVSAFVNAFTKIIICEIAVLKENDSISSVTFLIVACSHLLLRLVGIDRL